MTRSLGLDAPLYDYLLSVSPPEHPLLAELRQRTASLSGAGMQIGRDQGALFQILVKLTGARRCLEVGVFTGYSSLAVGLALPPDGQITACDINPKTTAIAQRFWKKASLADRIDLRIGPAGDTLDALIAGGAAGSYDFAFVDADKTGYAGYHEQVLTLLRPGGLVAYDNVLWGGSVIDDTDQSDDTVALRAFNAMLAADDRVQIAMLPIGDGVTLAVRR
ncbi:class I SAM-dependent methyltransferase [Ferrovibrio xuzhouensis]|uniref:Class I SAM-dependent methyltransferase n=1 Tax=Ferrovibrio xuzhouensis TaxID=1576914 RepID=A0ABV7VB98_9PROT